MSAPSSWSRLPWRSVDLWFYRHFGLHAKLERIASRGTICLIQLGVTVGAVENIKEVADLVKKFNDIELNRRILTLENEVLDLSREKRRAEEKIEELERTLKLRKELYFYEPFYWTMGDTIPYCPSCWESKTITVHVVFGHDRPDGSMWHCPSCKHSYYPKAFRRSLIASAARRQ